MTLLPSVICAEYRDGYRIHLTFNVRSYFLEGGTVAWLNGADTAPETLYEYQGAGSPPNRGLQPTLAAHGRPAKRALQGRELSCNNLVDLDAAWQLVAKYDAPASAPIKHANPCGCAE